MWYNSYVLKYQLIYEYSILNNNKQVYLQLNKIIR
jgi:hypothetical protein